MVPGWFYKSQVFQEKMPTVVRWSADSDARICNHIPVAAAPDPIPQPEPHTVASPSSLEGTVERFTREKENSWTFMSAANLDVPIPIILAR